MKDGPLFAMLLAALISLYCWGRQVEPVANASPFSTSDEGEKSATLRDRVFAVLQSMPPSIWDEDEPQNDREARLDFAAHLIATVSRDYRDAAALLTLWWFESRGALYVWRGCRPEEIPRGAPNCSGGHARSPWQLEECACPEGWELPRGSDEALYEFARYASGSSCEHPQAEARARDYQLRMMQLQR